MTQYSKILLGMKITKTQAPFRICMLNWLHKKGYNGKFNIWWVSFFMNVNRPDSKDQTHYYYKSHNLLKQLFSDHQKLVISKIWEILLQCLIQPQDNEGHKNNQGILLILSAHSIKEFPNQISFWSEFCSCIWWRVY